MKTLALILALSLAGCVHKRQPVPSPEYAGVTRKAEDITETIDLAQSSNKEVKSLHRQSMSLLERLDYKTMLLLEK